MRKKLWLALLCAILLLGMFSATALAETVDSGTCGENLTWTLDDQGVLTISGEGEMDDYRFDGRPWGYSFNDQIASIVIDDGVRNIGGCAFTDFTKLKKVSLGKGVTSIEIGAFYGCNSLDSCIIPGNVKEIGWGAFRECKSLKSVKFTGNAPMSIGEKNF